MLLIILYIYLKNIYCRVGSVKQNIKEKVSNEANHYLGESMTFTLFEFLKDFAIDLVAEQPEKEVVECITKLVCIIFYYFTLSIKYIIIKWSFTFKSIENDEEITKKATKKETMSKSQKRKQWDRLDSKGEKPRGYDWIDIVKHLSQTGSSKVEVST